MKAVITPALEALAVPVDNLTTDPDNARRGDVAAVRRSLNVFGQRKPVVVKRTGTDAHGRPTGVVTAGNHTFMAALELGWDHIAAVFVDDDATTARAYALADNRTGELATWDYETLAGSLKDLQGDGFDMDALGWKDYELEALCGAEWSPPAEDGALEDFDAPGGKSDKHTIILAVDAWVIVEEALARARDNAGDSGMTDEAALVFMSKRYLNP